jgi:hypothetical protein
MGRPGEAKSAILEAEKVLQPTIGSQMAKEIQKAKSQLGL